jgi:hypothetical protein
VDEIGPAPVHGLPTAAGAYGMSLESRPRSRTTQIRRSGTCCSAAPTVLQHSATDWSPPARAHQTAEFQLRCRLLMERRNHKESLMIELFR